MGFLVISALIKACCYPFYLVDKVVSDYHERQIGKLELEVLKEKEKLNKLELELLKMKRR